MTLKLESYTQVKLASINQALVAKSDTGVWDLVTLLHAVRVLEKLQKIGAEYFLDKICLTPFLSALSFIFHWITSSQKYENSD